MFSARTRTYTNPGDLVSCFPHVCIVPIRTISLILSIYINLHLYIVTSPNWMVPSPFNIISPRLPIYVPFCKPTFPFLPTGPISFPRLAPIPSPLCSHLVPSETRWSRQWWQWRFLYSPLKVISPTETQGRLFWRLCPWVTARPADCLCLLPHEEVGALNSGNKPCLQPALRKRKWTWNFDTKS